MSHLSICDRKNTSELIRELMTSCGPATVSELCDYVNATSQNANHNLGSSPIGDGIKAAMWKLSLALLFKVVITIFTFGIKVGTMESLKLVGFSSTLCV